MEERLSRRSLAKLAGAAGIAAIMPKAGAQEKEPPDAELKELESKLAAPFSEEARPIAKKSLQNVENSAKERLKHKLPENSEPCTTYRVKGR